jgi:hypothetical protein
MSQTQFRHDQLGPNVGVIRQDFTATASQTTFVMTGVSFSNGILFVYAGGALLKLTSDYTISGSDTVILSTALDAGVFVSLLLLTPAASTFLSASAVAVPTYQTFLSGGGTYNTAAGARQLRIRMVAGGGGGGASDTLTTDAVNGSASSFGSTTVNGGSKGLVRSAAGPQGGPGGTGGTTGTGTQVVRLGGRKGASGSDSAGVAAGDGGDSAFFGGGGAGAPYNTDAAGAGVANTGGGGGAAATAPSTGSGGGGGESVEFVVNAPSASYAYTVGSGGAGMISTTNDGGSGAAGIIIVEERY